MTMRAHPEKTSDPSRPKVEANGARPQDPEPLSGGLDALDPRLLLHLQRTVGNQAVAQLVAQRRAASPTADPKFQALTRDVRGKQRLLHAPRTGRAAAGGAQAAAHAPPDDKEAQAKTAQSGKMAAAKPGTFDKAAFIAAVDQAIAAQAPKTLDDADKFATSGKADRAPSRATSPRARRRRRGPSRRPRRRRRTCRWPRTSRSRR